MQLHKFSTHTSSSSSLSRRDANETHGVLRPQTLLYLIPRCCCRCRRHHLPRHHTLLQVFKRWKFNTLCGLFAYFRSVEVRWIIVLSGRHVDGTKFPKSVDGYSLLLGKGLSIVIIRKNAVFIYCWMEIRRAIHDTGMMWWVGVDAQINSKQTTCQRTVSK